MDEAKGKAEMRINICEKGERERIVFFSFVRI